MLIVGAGVLTGVVAFIATLSMVLVNYDTEMLLIEGAQLINNHLQDI